MKVNDKIKFMRETKKWSQEEMASKLGMSTNGYSKIERGETRLTIQKLEQIVKVFNINILELMALGEKNSIHPNSQELTFEIMQLKQTISYQEELLTSKDQIIKLQQTQIETLQSLLNTMEILVTRNEMLRLPYEEETLSYMQKNISRHSSHTIYLQQTISYQTELLENKDRTIQLQQYQIQKLQAQLY